MFILKKPMPFILPFMKNIKKFKIIKNTKINYQLFNHNIFEWPKNKKIEMHESHSSKPYIINKANMHC